MNKGSTQTWDLDKKIDESDIRPSFSQNDVPEKRMFQFGIKMEITRELEIV